MQRHRILGAAIAAAVAAASPVQAQPTDVPAQIKLIETQPADMDRATWKDRRREVARKLGQSKDKRAVAVLIKLAETETFDIIGEIAIEALGNLGDGAAAPTLQKIAADPARDKAQRDLAKKALARLGPEPVAGSSKPPAAGATPATGPSASATGATAAPRPPTATTAPGSPTAPRPTTTAGTTGTPTGRAGVAERSSATNDGGSATSALGSGAAPSLALPVIADDAIAAYERVTFAGGTASFGYDTVRKRIDFDADIAGQYQKRIERESMAWGTDAGAHIVGGYINPEGPAVSRGLQIDVTADGELRFYSGAVYGVGRAAGAAQLNYVADVTDDPDNTLKDSRFTADLQVAIGGGYGRLIDVGAAIRVRRLARTLEAARALGTPINATTARRLQLTWWALRGERSTYSALVATVAILREAGILLGEPDAGLSYEILNVLRDSQLYLRPSGIDAQLVFGEGYLQRPDDPAPAESGRVEQLLASLGYGAQLDHDKLEASGNAYARLRLFAPDTQPSPWAAGVQARLRRFSYGDHGDPIGALDVSADLRLSNDDLEDSQIGQRIAGQLGFTWWINAASGFRLAASVGEDRGELFVGAELTATYGLLDGTFAR